MNTLLESIVLVRHARSTANEDPNVYRTTPDHTIPLSRPDDDPAALRAGERLASLAMDPRSLCSFSSTYLRCAQTERLVLERAFGADVSLVRRRSSFLLREQEFGDWDCLTEAEMEADDPSRYAKRKRLTDNYGRFYFRYPGGESRADVTQRISIFIGKIHRSRYPHHIVFLHGVTQRAFRMAWFNRSVDWFEEEPNARNASMVLIRRGADGHWAEQALETDEQPVAESARENV